MTPTIEARDRQARELMRYMFMTINNYFNAQTVQRRHAIETEMLYCLNKYRQFEEGEGTTR